MAEQGRGESADFTELAQFEIDGRSVRLLERDSCFENEVVVLGRVDSRGREPVAVGMLNRRLGLKPGDGPFFRAQPDPGCPVCAGITFLEEVLRTVPYRQLGER